MADGGLPVSGTDVDFHGAGLGLRRAQPHDQADALAASSASRRYARPGAVVGMNDVQKGLLAEFGQVPAEEVLFGRARFDPVEADRVEPVDHVDGREIARHVRVQLSVCFLRRIRKVRSGSSKRSTDRVIGRGESVRRKFSWEADQGRAAAVTSPSAAISRVSSASSAVGGRVDA